MDLDSAAVHKVTELLEATKSRRHDVLHERNQELLEIDAPGTDRLIFGVAYWCVQEHLDDGARPEVIEAYAERICTAWPPHPALNTMVIATVLRGILGDREARESVPLGQKVGANLMIAGDYMEHSGAPASELVAHVAALL
jgi:hypothetical protein